MDDIDFIQIKDNKEPSNQEQNRYNRRALVTNGGLSLQPAGPRYNRRALLTT